MSIFACCVTKEKDNYDEQAKGMPPGQPVLSPTKGERKKRVFDLPPSLLQKLATIGIEPSAQPLDIPSAEKYIFDAREIGTSTGRVVLHSRKFQKTKWIWEGGREVEVLQSVAGHPNIIRMVAFFDKESSAEGGSHGPCMVLERVEPLGFDLCHVLNQYAHANRVLPMKQMLDYTGQLLGATECLHGHGWVHCDIKVENVLITADHVVKLIDMGLAKKAGIEKPPDRVGYMPPEFDFREITADPSADVWCLGSLMVSLTCRRHLDLLPGTEDYMIAIKRGVTDLIKNTWKVPLEPALFEAIDGTLAWKAEKRWTVPELRKWLEPKAKVSSANELEYLAIEEHAMGAAAENFGRLNGQRQTGYGVNVTRGSRWVGKYVGMHQGIEQKQVLDLIGDGVTILFIDRGEKGIVKFPSPFDKIQAGDWIYLRTRSGGDNSEVNDKVAALMEEAHKAKDRNVVEIFLEFDEFEFPEHTWGASIGPACFAAPGQVAMDMRKNFGIGLTFIKRQTVCAMPTPKKNAPGQKRTSLSRKQTAHLDDASASAETELVEIRRDTTVEPGDHGIVVRVPDRATGLTKSIISDAILEELFDEAKYNKKLNLLESKIMGA